MISVRCDMREGLKRKCAGNIMDFVTAGITVLAIAIIVMASFHSMGLMVKKLEVSQIARKYILIMETKGCLEETAGNQMYAELQEVGLKSIDITGTTRQPAGYGEPIVLCIKGCISGSAAGDDIWSEGFEAKEYYVEERRMSTAKS